ncbi:YdeI family protein [Pseudoduganella ginsengisoli]|uniref:YdhG-like domain-containing protein n=1 Tax=Pseudoduganella ginsengisoli TaxID=1462440 RepID=A0A6L6Q804_9BURK|nr:YdeI/OmpD-associated family protein [Pseudoduganella ginsengisoli]MTW05579.1 hypothetical protein [Pseudoduganella ginsengisoli]
MTKKNPKVDWFFDKDTPWKDAYAKLRSILLGCGLTEELKWGVPCYTEGGHNVVLIHGFKEYCALLFFKGVLMKDFNAILVQQTANVQSSRQIRFTSAAQVEEMQHVLKVYVEDAIAVEKSGAEVAFKKTDEFNMPLEFQIQLDELPELKAAFEALTPGRQRGYLLHFSSAKQAKTRESRVEKCIPKIMEGKGLDD